MPDNTRPAVLITGASAGIGATYADRFARRGHDLVLVARDTAKLEALAARLRAEHGITAEVLTADLTDSAALARVEQRLAGDARIGVLVNNAGAALPGDFGSTEADRLEWLIRLNVTAPTRLARAAVPGFTARGGSAIVNIASVLAVAPELMPGIYPATKAFMLSFSQALQAELGPRGVYVQAVLPAATRTDIWKHVGADVTKMPGVMAVEDMVDAAPVEPDQREPVTIPPMPDAAQWEAFEATRLALVPGFRQEQPAARYRAA